MTEEGAKLIFSSENRCANCRKTELESSLKLCQRCKIASYCSKKCQADDFAHHRMDCKMSVFPEIKENDPEVGKKLLEKLQHLSFKWNIVKSVKTVKAVEDFIKDLDDLVILSCQAEDLYSLTLCVVFRSLSYLYIDMFRIASFEIRQWAVHQPTMYEAYFENKGTLAEHKEHFVMNDYKKNLIEKEREETDRMIQTAFRLKCSDIQLLFVNVNDETYDDSIKRFEVSLEPIMVAVLILKLWVVGRENLNGMETKKQVYDVLRIIFERCPTVLELLIRREPPVNPFQWKMTKESVPFWISSFAWPLFNDNSYSRGIVASFMKFHIENTN